MLFGNMWYLDSGYKKLKTSITCYLSLFHTIFQLFCWHFAYSILCPHLLFIAWLYVRLSSILLVVIHSVFMPWFRLSYNFLLKIIFDGILTMIASYFLVAGLKKKSPFFAHIGDFPLRWQRKYFIIYIRTTWARRVAAPGSADVDSGSSITQPLRQDQLNILRFLRLNFFIHFY